MPRVVQARRATASGARWTPIAARGHVLRPVDAPHRPHARPTTASSATAGTSATSARSSSGASTTSSSRARRCGRPRAARKPGFRAANLCWWYAMGATTDLTVTPRPIYHADGAQVARLLHVSAAAARQPDRPARRVPAVPVLGPDGEHQVDQVDRRRGARSCSTRSRSTCCWSTCRTSTTTTSASGPTAPEAVKAARELDEVAGDLIDHARGARRPGRRAVSEYGITDARAPGRDQPRAAPRRAC